MRYVIYDLDGCVSDDTMRRHHADRGHWTVYHARAPLDKPVDTMITANLNGDLRSKRVHVLFLTGREERYRKEAQDWLRLHFGDGIDYTLMMRPNNNKMRSPELKVQMLREERIDPRQIAVAADDRADVLAAYHDYGIKGLVRATVDGMEAWRPTKNRPKSAAELLAAAAETLGSRNAEYKDNWRNVPEVVKALFPEGVDPALVEAPEWHLFELMIVKMTRYANSGMKHRDSIHDLGIYAFMIEAIHEERNQ